jgi:hypothetical protein
MKINVKEQHLNILVDSLKLWIQHYEERGYGPEHAIIAASMILSFNKTAGDILDNSQNEPDDEDEKHPEFVRGADPDEHFVLGKGYVKKT